MGANTVQICLCGDLESVTIGCSRRVPADASETYVQRLRAQTGPPQALDHRVEFKAKAK
jgi:hypothetical protein